MKIHKIRYGRATNSSSTHSVVFWKGAGAPPQDDPQGREYGWNEFVASSEVEKRAYLDSMWATIHMDWEELDRRGIPTIDHQSVWNLPKEVGKDKPSKRFFDTLANYIVKNPKLFILGGSDGSDNRAVETYGAAAQQWSLASDLRYGNNSRIREDKKGKYWTLLTKGWEGPKKYRFSLDGGEVEPQKAFSPELLDIKITDYCTYGCDFCYQGSTKAGKHAPLETLLEAVDLLKGMKVMEVAIGGGEPTEHPFLNEFLRGLNAAGITPNLTTKNPEWVQKYFKGQSWDERHNLGIGLSISSAKEILDRNSLGHHAVTYHAVLGATHPADLFDILMKAPRVLLLDWKSTGRGAKGPKYPVGEWVNVVKAVKALKVAKDVDGDGYEWTIGIDTPLAAKYAKDLQAMGVDHTFYETQEGKFSAYWDLVKGQIGPSSYDPARMVPLKKFSTRSFLAEFRKW